MEQQAMGAEQAQSGGESIGDVIVSVDKNLGMLADAASKSQQIPDEIKSGLAQIREAFSALVNQLMDSAEGGSAPQPEQGVSTPEQGGNPNARPMTPERG